MDKSVVDKCFSFIFNKTKLLASTDYNLQKKNAVTEKGLLPSRFLGRGAGGECCNCERTKREKRSSLGEKLSQDSEAGRRDIRHKNRCRKTPVN